MLAARVIHNNDYCKKYNQINHYGQKQDKCTRTSKCTLFICTYKCMVDIDVLSEMWAARGNTQYTPTFKEHYVKGTCITRLTVTVKNKPRLG